MPQSITTLISLEEGLRKAKKALLDTLAEHGPMNGGSTYVLFLADKLEREFRPEPRFVRDEEER